MNLLDQLHDIEGLDPISAWPLAVGWWIMILAGILIGCILIYYALSKIKFKRSWKNDSLRRLADLEKNLSDITARETVITLSEYLRRIALQRFARKECAGLMGEAWLKWLAKHDPKEFEWEKKGVLLISTPYAPPNTILSANQVKDLIQAVRNWVI